MGRVIGDWNVTRRKRDASCKPPSLLALSSNLTSLTFHPSLSRSNHQSPDRRCALSGVLGYIFPMHADRSDLLTEQRLPDSMGVTDTMPLEEAIALMNAQDVLAVAAVATQRARIAQAVELVATSLGAGGRLIYVGAGTSGRLGVLDASECPPTFRADPRQVQGIIAGGESAMFRAREGAEDSPEDGAAAIDEKQVDHRQRRGHGNRCGGTTPFVHRARTAGMRRGARVAKTIFLSCAARAFGETPVDVAIRPLTGPEVIAGSTRLKAGTATKLVAQYHQHAGDGPSRQGSREPTWWICAPSNAKRRDRAVRIVCTLTGVDRDAAGACCLTALTGTSSSRSLCTKKSLTAADGAPQSIAPRGKPPRGSRWMITDREIRMLKTPARPRSSNDGIPRPRIAGLNARIRGAREYALPRRDW